jgi:uncharacterized coiled-coil protein SlyX
MSEDELEARVAAVERALADGDATVAALSDAADVHDRLDDVEARLDALAERADALEATVQSLHGYVGELEHVNERVERRADAARAAVDRLDGRRQYDSRTGETDSETSDSATSHAEVRQGQRDATGSHRGDRTSDGDVDAADSLLNRVRDSL